MIPATAGPFQAIGDLVRTFEKHAVRYLIGGSVASSLFGRFRTTNDIDCLIAVTSAVLDPLVAELQNNFIVDEVALKEHLLLKQTYNIIHEQSYVKVDLFSAQNDFHYQELERAVTVAPEKTGVSFRVATAEDIILAKLLWLMRSNFTSERQQRDLEGIVAVAGSSLDLVYLRHWSEKLGVTKQLNELLEDL